MNNNTVYAYINKINSKIYVGRTMQQVHARAGRQGEGYKSCTKFIHAIRKYGWDKFELHILAEGLSYEDSVDLERKYIKLYQSNKQEYGYNIFENEPNRGTLPEEVKAKLRLVNSNRSEEYRRHLSEGHIGQKAWNKGIKTGPLTAKQKEKFSEARKGNKNSIHVAVRNIETGEVFRSGAEAGRSIGVTSEAIFAAIKNNKPCKGRYFERVCEQMPNDYRKPA